MLWEELPARALARGISLPDDATRRFALYFEALITVNQHLNLTRITEPNEVLVKHFLDSLELLAWRPHLQGNLLDIGSGAGLPGIPLKIARPDICLTMIDSSLKRVGFLREAALAIGLDNITACHGRAEELARNPSCRDHYDFVVSRAVARLNILLELCLPFVRPGGFFVAYKGPEGERELAQSAKALAALRGRYAGCHHYTLPEGMGERTLIIIEKEDATPEEYPRRVGIPAKRPLSGR